jgi:predicted nucleic acid-binding protein
VKLLLDTSVLVAAMVETHPDHEVALPWLQQIKDGTHEGLLSTHALAELYAVLTRLPVRPKISPAL